MRPMTLLASVLFTSLVAATAIVEVGCSSDDNSNTANTPFDSGNPITPEASAGPGSVTVAVACPAGVASCGVVVSADGTPQDGGPNGFVGADGGSPLVDCAANAGACIAPQGTTLYTYAVQGFTLVGWTVPVEGGIATISTDTSLQITAGTGSPLTATFATANSGPDASVPADGG
jgi:hypothetical protein